MSPLKRVLVRRGATPALDLELRDDEPADGRARLYLHPGRLFASAKATAITTIVASSVALCLYDPILGAGGMCHFQLPRAAGGAAIERLIRRLLALGADSARVQARLFGGACPNDALHDDHRHLGARNLEIARRILQAQSIVIQSEDVGGTRSRKLRFCTDGGSAWARQL